VAQLLTKSYLSLVQNSSEQHTTLLGAVLAGRLSLLRERRAAFTSCAVPELVSSGFFNRAALTDISEQFWKLKKNVKRKN
jgi:hypothetical protein